MDLSEEYNQIGLQAVVSVEEASSPKKKRSKDRHLKEKSEDGADVTDDAAGKKARKSSKKERRKSREGGEVTDGGIEADTDAAQDHERSNNGHEDESSSNSIPPALAAAAASFHSSTMLLSNEAVEKAKKDQEDIARLIPSKEILLRFEKVDKYVEIVEAKPFRKKKVTLKQILFSVSGCVRPGEIMGLMGPSGSGKTTLLNVLAGRTTLRVEGDVTLNGEKFTKAMKRKVAFVMQQDIFFEHLTVREQLTFTALLRFPRKMRYEDKIAQVESTMESLGISKVADSPIMFVSGGERKRVNIGTELLTNPTLLYLDEPTSGLDSTTSVQLMKTLRLLALRGKTIVTSIHQPSSQVFRSFDKLLLLADGKTIYSGPPQKVTQYFGDMGFKSPPDYNPADFIMDLVNAEDNPRELLQQKFLEVGIKTLDLPPPLTPEAESFASLAQVWPTNYFSQLRVLMHRNAKNSKANLFTFLNFFQSIALALIAGLCWFRLADVDTTIADRQGFIFFVMTFWPFQTLFSGLLSFPSEREVLMKERASGSYHLSAYFVSQALSTAPLVLLLPAIFLIISYWMANLNPYFPNFLGFMLAELSCVWAGESIGLFLGAAILNMQEALVAATISMLSLMLVGGFFVRNLPIFVHWARYLSIFTYAFNACLLMEFDENRVFQCSDVPEMPQCTTQETISGADVLDSLEIYGVNRMYGWNIAMLFIFMIGFRVLAYLSLRFLHTKHFRQ